MRYTSKRGTVINIPDGLTDKQIKAIKADADAGYGTRAQETATRLGKASTSTPTKVASPSDIASMMPGGSNYVAPGSAPAPAPEDTGASDEAGWTARQQTRLDWLLKNRPNDPEVKKLQGKKAAAGRAPGDQPPGATPPGGTPPPGEPTVPGSGATGESLDAFLANIFENFKPWDDSGAPKVYTAAELDAMRAETQDSLYREETKYLERDRARALEESKQELANRGIPYDPAAAQDPNSKSLYGRTIGGIEENFRTQDQSARDRARAGADARLETVAGVNRSAHDAWVNAATAGYNSQLDALNAGGNLLNTLITKYGMTREEAQRELDRQLQRKIEKEKNRTAINIANIGARSSGGGSNDFGGGEPQFETVGF